MNMISKVREALVQPAKQPLSLQENQIIQGKITKIYPDNKAEIQIGNHKLLADVQTPLSIGKSYFFQVQAADHIQLKVLNEQGGQPIEATNDLEGLLRQLGLKATKINSEFARELVQEKIPFNQEQLSQALSLLAKASDQVEAPEIVKSMIAQKLPITDNVFQALAINQQTSASNLLRQVYADLALLQSPSEAERTLMQKLAALIARPASQEQPAVTQKVMKNITASPSNLQALKALGLLELSMSENRWAREAVKVSSIATERGNTESMADALKLPVNAKAAEELSRVLTTLTENGEQIQRTANRIHTIFSGLQTASLTKEQWTQVQQRLEKELFPLLPKETIQMIQHGGQHVTDNQGSATQQQGLAQALEVLMRGSTFQELATIAATEVPKMTANDQVFSQQSLPEQFLTHLRTYIQSIGMNDEHELKLNLENPEQLRAMSIDNPSVKSMLLGLLSQQEQGGGERAQTLVHFINGMQLQSVTEANNLVQASFMLPGDKLALNQDIFMQFEGKKEASDQINADYCRIFFVLDLAHIKETMIDMHVQKRIISVTVFNEQEEPLGLDNLRPMLKEALEKIDYQLSAVKWKPLYEQDTAMNPSLSSKEVADRLSSERYDFLV